MAESPRFKPFDTWSRVILCTLLSSLVVIGRALYRAVGQCHNGVGEFRVGDGVHDTYTFQCDLLLPLA